MPVIIVLGLILAGLFIARTAGASTSAGAIDTQAVTSDAPVSVAPVASAHKGNAVPRYVAVSGNGPQPFSNGATRIGGLNGGAGGFGLQSILDNVLATFGVSLGGGSSGFVPLGQTRFGNDYYGDVSNTKATEQPTPTIGGGTSGTDGGGVGIVGGGTVGGVNVPIATPLAPFTGGTPIIGAGGAIGLGTGMFTSAADTRLVQKV